MCARHYGNLRRYGNPIPARERSLRERVAEIGFTETEQGCLEWNGHRNEAGYGMISHTRSDVRDARVHRLIYEWEHGELPQGFVVRHTCDNPPCAALNHLVAGRHVDNMRDMVARRRHWRHDREVCDSGHDLSLPGATHPYADGGRCVACRRERANRYKRVRRPAT